MSESNENLLLEHDADGIKEFDNVLPRWWLWLFYLTTIFAVVYMLYFHVFDMGKSSAERYQAEMAWAEEEYGRPGEVVAVSGGSTNGGAAEAGVPEEETYALKTDAESLEKGKAVYMQYCFPCHMEGGRGLVGPNLTDEYYLHGPSYADSIRTILNGVLEKGMISWRPVLSKEDTENVASYIYSLRGTNPENPKEPQGEKYEGEARGDKKDT